MGRRALRRTGGEVDHPRNHAAIERRLAGGTRLVAQQPVSAGLHEALLPAPNDGFALARPPHDLGGAQAVRCEQDDSGAPNMLLGAVAIGYDRRKSPAIGSLHVHYDPFAHPADSHSRKPQGILKRTRSLD